MWSMNVYQVCLNLFFPWFKNLASVGNMVQVYTLYIRITSTDTVNTALKNLATTLKGHLQFKVDFEERFSTFFYLFLATPV